MGIFHGIILGSTASISGCVICFHRENDGKSMDFGVQDPIIRQTRDIIGYDIYIYRLLLI